MAQLRVRIQNREKKTLFWSQKADSLAQTRPPIAFVKYRHHLLQMNFPGSEFSS